MRAVLARELTVMARSRALTFAIGAHVTLLVGFVCLWSGGVPGLAANLYEQQHAFHTWVLVALLPWTAARLMATDRGDRLALVAALIARRPGSVLVSKVVGVSAVLTFVLLSGLPPMIIAQQMSAMPMSRLIPDVIGMTGIAVLIAALAVGWTLLLRGRLPPWLAATASAVMIVLWLPALGPVATGVAALVVGTIVTAAVAVWSNRSSRYVDG